MSDDIQRNENIKGGQIAQNVVGNQIQNNFYSHNTFNKPLKNYKETIEVSSKSVFDKNSFYSKWLFICLVLCGALVVSFLISKDLYLPSIIFIIFIVFLCYKLYKYGLISNKDNSKLILEDSKLILNSEEIDFINIRSFLMEKNIFSYQFFIYEIDKIEPKIKFSTISIHTAIAIEELLKYRINKAIELENN